MMNDKNKLVLKQLLADIRSLGYKTYKSRAKYTPNNYYRITNELTKNGFHLLYHPENLSYIWTMGDFGFFTFQEPFIKTYVPNMRWLESKVIVKAKLAYRSLLLLNEIDSVVFKDYKLYCEYIKSTAKRVQEVD